MSRRHFSASALLNKVLQWTKQGTTEEVGWVVTNVETTIDHAPHRLAEKAAKAVIQGNPHKTRRRDGTVDPYHASGAILTQSGRHLTSFHAYGDGSVTFSKSKYNTQDGNAGESSGTASTFQRGLTWQMASDNSCALWWDGSKWHKGQWSGEHGKWIAYYNGQWYAWE